MSPPTPDFARIRLLALDVDGVLTDGSIMLDDSGRETKRFNVRDGLGIAVWQRLGFHAAVITRRSGGAVEHRMRELSVPNLVQGCRDKAAAVSELCNKLGISLDQAAFLGDDWPDLPAMAVVGLPVAVADADPRVKAAASITLTRPGGHGAARELVERLLEAKGLMEQAVALYRGA